MSNNFEKNLAEAVNQLLLANSYHLEEFEELNYRLEQFLDKMEKKLKIEDEGKRLIVIGALANQILRRTKTKYLKKT